MEDIMPLFGPNVKKMREIGDISGLIRLLSNKDAKVHVDAGKSLVELKAVAGLANALANYNILTRIGAAQCLKEIGGDDAIYALIAALQKTLRYGEFRDQVEAIMIIRGRWSNLYISLEGLAQSRAFKSIWVVACSFLWFRRCSLSCLTVVGMLSAGSLP